MGRVSDDSFGIKAVVLLAVGYTLAMVGLQGVVPPASLIGWGACPTGPFYRGACPTRPKRWRLAA
jgi:hypothetical protein